VPRRVTRSRSDGATYELPKADQKVIRRNKLSLAQLWAMLSRCAAPHADVDLPTMASGGPVGEAADETGEADNGGLYLEVVEWGETHYMAGSRRGVALTPEELENAANPTRAPYVYMTPEQIANLPGRLPSGDPAAYSTLTFLIDPATPSQGEITMDGIVAAAWAETVPRRVTRS
jgi:hypothetical protein